MSKTEFEENLEEKKLIEKRMFSAPVELVWRAWTEAELLDQWFAPKPFRSVTQEMEFREGGSRLYCMRGPKGEAHWGKTTFTRISIHDFFDAVDYFCDENGKENKELPGTRWHVVFRSKEAGTELVITTSFESVEALEQLVKMGVKEGTAMSHDNLDEVLRELQI